MGLGRGRWRKRTIWQSRGDKALYNAKGTGVAGVAVGVGDVDAQWDMAEW